jgi:PAS domain S-box-containing protein
VERITGYGQNEVIGASFQKFLPESEISRGIRILTQAIEGEVEESVEANILKKDGSMACLEFHGSPILMDRKLTGFQGVARDITERKRMEDELRRYSEHLEDLVQERTKALQKAQRMAAIGETAAMVGHDLRNPLQAMTNTLYLMKRLATSGKAKDGKEAVGLLGTLHDAIQYMDKIVSDLQDYARPVGAKLVETSLPDLVRATVSNVKIPGNVEVTVDIQGSSSNVKLDPILFRRVLTNLILNGVQAMPEGGKLTITGSRESESFDVTVQDTGVGIAPENLGRVFNPFFTTKAQGQGLGLAVCKRLMEAQGGTIEVSSQVGEGSTFTLKIPTNITLGAT